MDCWERQYAILFGLISGLIEVLLRSLLVSSLNKLEESLLLKDAVSFKGLNWGRCSFIFSNDLLLEIKASSISFLAHSEDCISWYLVANGSFNLEEAYRLALALIGNVTNNSFKGESVWKVMSSPKRCLLWQCCHLSIPVRSILTSRGFNLPDLCTFCNDCLESIVHLLRGFPFARSFWNSFPFSLQQNVFYGTNLLDWLRLNCYNSTCHRLAGISWKIIFLLDIWNLWLHRNKVVFNNV